MRPLEAERRGDPRALARWVDSREADEEFADLLDEIREASRKGLRLR